MQLLLRRALRQAPLVQRVQPAEDGVAAHGLVIGLQDDRLAVRRYLDRTTRHTQRPLSTRRLQRLPLQASAHAVGLRRQLPAAGEESAELLIGKFHCIAPGNHPQQRRCVIVRLVAPGHAGRSAERSRHTVQPISLRQLATLALGAAEPFTHLGADATQHRLRRKPTGRRQVEPLPATGIADAQALPGPHGEARPRQDVLPIQARAGIGASQRQPGIDRALQLHATEGNLQQWAAPGVFKQTIGPGRRVPVHRTARRNTQVLPAATAGILQQTQGAWLDHTQAAHASASRR